AVDTARVRFAATGEWCRRLAALQKCARWRSLTVWPLSTHSQRHSTMRWRHGFFSVRRELRLATLQSAAAVPAGAARPHLINFLNATGEEGPGCAWLVSPWVDLTMSGSTLTGKDSVDPLIHKTYLEELAAAYVPEEINRADPRVSPLFANLTGFPPTLIQVGSAETLLADATRFAAAAGAVDAAVTLEIWPHMIHAWHLWNAHLEAGRRALGSAGRFIRAHV